MGISDKLVAFALGDCRAPEAVRAVARLSLIDWMAVAIAGKSEPVAAVMRAFAGEEGGTGQAGLIGGGRAPMRMAALVNGTVSHALDYDDTHFGHIGHPSVGVIPAALAVAEQDAAGGAALQEAALIGMEASIRFGEWLGRAHYQVGFHQTATAGAVGACVAAGRLLKLKPDQMATALGLVATRASGLKSQFGTSAKPFNAGLSASNGVEAAQMARLGMEARLGALEGPLGFGPTHHGEAVEEAFDGIGEAWRFETVSHKFHACCHGLHAVLEAAAGLDVAPDAIAAVRVETHPRWMSVCNQAAPETGLGAKFSYSTVLAMHFLGHDTARLESYSDGLCGDAHVRALRGRVEVSANEDVGEMQARLAVETRAGEVLHAFHDLDVPMALKDRRAKIAAKAAALLGTTRAQRIETLVETRAAPRELAAELAV
ncbi:MmgE/PrpD family protein [Alisedimentitalea sp. MJ-SS2]|uniref:MmgE/PrpD family protein n=1 Tax=Aliisedimentitalea sp. MJ-SS2 TaxID=3049795 RepID=UPI002914F2E8|nr:MmgE/PrpD family protein [Alisedimentitalea sp. MJ-SS2]MDU8929694.1 MmgE/PrpD family protein [Alisedimentitalea sp. MJ-SS2]